MLTIVAIISVAAVAVAAILSMYRLASTHVRAVHYLEPPSPVEFPAAPQASPGEVWDDYSGEKELLMPVNPDAEELDA